MFARLAELKSQLLAEALRETDQYDEQLRAIGAGVAGQIEAHCNRKLLRGEAVTEVFSADRCEFLLARYPVETVTKSEVKLSEAAGWEEQASDFIRSLDAASGVIDCGSADVGPYYAQVRFTYTGGFWVPSEAGVALPVGATALPDDLKLAWILQCREVWKKTDVAGVGIVAAMQEKIKVPDLSNLELIPQVKQILQPHVRIVMV